MKKLFTSLVAVFCAMAGMAQTLTFSHDGVAIENGSTFYSRDINEILAGLESLSSNRRLICRAMLLLTFM